MKPLITGTLLTALAATALGGPCFAQEDGRTDGATAAGIVANRLRLEFHPVAPVVQKGRWFFSDVVPMQPAGFRADEFQHYVSSATARILPQRAARQPVARAGPEDGRRGAGPYDSVPNSGRVR